MTICHNDTGGATCKRCVNAAGACPRKISARLYMQIVSDESTKCVIAPSVMNVHITDLTLLDMKKKTNSHMRSILFTICLKFLMRSFEIN